MKRHISLNPALATLLNVSKDSICGVHSIYLNRRCGGNCCTVCSRLKMLVLRIKVQEKGEVDSKFPVLAIVCVIFNAT